jgi:hypothetical protein
MGHFLTSQESLVLSLIFKLLDKPRHADTNDTRRPNRTMAEYIEIAERAPKPKVLLWKINRAPLRTGTMSALLSKADIRWAAVMSAKCHKPPCQIGQIRRLS